MNKFKNIFNSDYGLIGMVHLMPLLGVDKHPGMDKVIEKALYDAEQLEKAGYDPLLIENNYDLPHEIFVKPGVIASFTLVVDIIKKKTNLPIGLCVLWNDYYTALSIAKIVGAKYIRVAVFVDNVETSYGTIYGNAKEVTDYAKKIGAEDVAIFTDIQVKHSKLLNVRPIKESAEEALEKGSDSLIVTGKWTGDSPKTEDLENVRSVGKDVKILVGSGADIENLETLLKYANGIIVGTYIKEGEKGEVSQHTNLKDETKRIDFIKAKSFADKFKDIVNKK